VRKVLFHLFYRMYFASEKQVTRTSKTPYNWKAVKISENFVWVAPTQLRGDPIFYNEEQPFSKLTRGAESNPARVLPQEVWHN
jgi:hypothetical protein